VGSPENIESREERSEATNEADERGCLLYFLMKRFLVLECANQSFCFGCLESSVQRRGLMNGLAGMDHRSRARVLGQ
jgi:hypothetical protein